MAGLVGFGLTAGLGNTAAALEVTIITNFTGTGFNRMNIQSTANASVLDIAESLVATAVATGRAAFADTSAELVGDIEQILGSNKTHGLPVGSHTPIGWAGIGLVLPVVLPTLMATEG